MGKNDNGNNGRTELVFVVDRSGSMGGLESDTIGGSTACCPSSEQLPASAG